MELLDSVFGFFDEGDHQISSSDDSLSGSSEGGDDYDEFDSEEREMSAIERKAFWETQHKLLEEALSRNSLSEKSIGQLTEVAVKTIKTNGVCCNCPIVKSDCRICALKYIAQQLRESRYNSALCKSKWRKSPDIPSGEHNYVDVVMESKSSKRGPIRVVIELNFRGEFEMARGSQEYNKLVNCLPEKFVGKSDKLKSVIKIMCSAAKKCMEDNNMHMGPWRKHKYMQAKWLGAPERIGVGALAIPAAAAVAAIAFSDLQRPPVPKFRTSMLTFDLHCGTAVEVL